MERTKQMLGNIITGKEKFKTTNELIEEYQRKLSPNILAYFYDDNYRLICSIARFYPILSSEDIASFCLQELDKSLMNFKFNQDTKFITYFSACFKNRLRMETQQMRTKKRKGWYNCEVLDEEDESLYYEDNYLDNICDVLNTYNFDKQERYQCLLKIAGYSLKEIAKIFNLSSICVYKRNQKIKQKILNSYIN